MSTTAATAPTLPPITEGSAAFVEAKRASSRLSSCYCESAGLVSAQIENELAVAFLRLDAIDELIPPIEVKLPPRERERWAELVEELKEIRAALGHVDEIATVLGGRS